MQCSYTSDPGKQDTYIQSAKKRGYDVLLMNGVDSHFYRYTGAEAGQSSTEAGGFDIIDKLVDKGDAAESVLNEDEEQTERPV